MNINVGDYVRTKQGIAKVIDLKENPYGEKTIYVLDNKIISMCECEEGILYSTINPFAEDLIDKFDINFGDESQIIKSSPNIIDLIEVGDCVNGELVDYIEEIYTSDNIYIGKFLYKKNNALIGGEEDVQTIVTHEQMEAMEYKIER